MGADISLTLLRTTRSLFFLLGWLVQPQFEGFYLVLSYLILLCLAVVSGRPALS